MNIYLNTFSSGDQFILRRQTGEVIVQRIFGTPSEAAHLNIVNSSADWHGAYCQMREKLPKTWRGGSSGPGYAPQHYQSDFQAEYVGAEADVADEIAMMLKCVKGQ